jgi:hypothetical protein
MRSILSAITVDRLRRFLCNARWNARESAVGMVLQRAGCASMAMVDDITAQLRNSARELFRMLTGQ